MYEYLLPDVTIGIGHERVMQVPSSIGRGCMKSIDAAINVGTSNESFKVCLYAQ